MPRCNLTVTRQKWPINGSFRIYRGAKLHAEVIYVEISQGDLKGCGEAVPYGRYGETCKSVMKQIKDVSKLVEEGITRMQLLNAMPAGAARNAIDAALWDLESKYYNQPPSVMLNMGELTPVLSCFTISLDAPEKMAENALKAQYHPLLKLKLGGGYEKDAATMRAVRKALPKHRLVVDANEGWTAQTLFPLLDIAYECKIELVEQPLPTNLDNILYNITSPVPLCADESFHTINDIEDVAKKYQAINIKTDKTGGLTHGLATLMAARNANLKIMVGCMVGTSLAMAPAFVLTKGADWVDLDGPLLLLNDRDNGLKEHNGILTPPDRTLWG